MPANFIERMIEAAESLFDSLERGQGLTQSTEADLRALVVAPFRLAHRVYPDRVERVNVLRGSRQPGRR